MTKRRWITWVALAFLLIDLAAFKMLRSIEADVILARSGLPERQGDPLDQATPKRGELIGPVILKAAGDGTILRATQGWCGTPSERPEWGAKAQVATVPPGSAEPVDRTLKGLSRVLATRVDGGRLTVIGTDRRCAEVSGWVSSDGGATWSRGGVPAGQWYPAPRPESTKVITPQGTKSAGCVPLTAENPVVPGGPGGILCPEQYAGLSPDQQRAGTAAEVIGARSMSQDGTGAWFTATTPSCPSSILYWPGTGRFAGDKACLDPRKAPLGIAVGRGGVIVQLGEDLMFSDDDGKTFAPLTGAG